MPPRRPQAPLSDLFTATPLLGGAAAVPQRVEQSKVASTPHIILANDLAAALEHLDDSELDRLQAAVTTEQIKRGKMPETPSGSLRKSTNTDAVQHLTPGKINAVR